MDLTGKIALVTGASRGVGRAIALAFARAGADVALAARSEAELENVAAEARALGQRALALRCDVTERAQVDAMVAAARDQLGPIDILVNNAGIGTSARTAELSDADWEHVLRINLTAAFYCTRAVLAEMQRRKTGRIINLASTAAKIPGGPYTAAYTSSKHGLLGFTRALALEVARDNITVNAICPGWVATDLAWDVARTVAAGGRMDYDQALASLARQSPQNRLIEPEEVAHVALFLAADEARGITGQGIEIDGGTVMS